MRGVWTLVCLSFSPGAFLQGRLQENLPKLAATLRTPTCHHLIAPLHPHSNIKRSIGSSPFDQLDNWCFEAIWNWSKKPSCQVTKSHLKPVILSQGEFVRQRMFALPGDLLGDRDSGWWHCGHLGRGRGAAPPHTIRRAAPIPRWTVIQSKGRMGKAEPPRFNPGLSSTRVDNYLAPFYFP